MSTIVYILVAVLVFGFLIAVHELGHFMAAKACGVRVNEFSVGMGPALLKKQKGAALEKDRRALEKFAPGVAGSIDYTPSIRAEELIFNDPENFTASPTDLIYLRAAVFVEARIPRTIPL